MQAVNACMALRLFAIHGRLETEPPLLSSQMQENQLDAELFGYLTSDPPNRMGAACCAVLGCHAELANPLNWDNSMDWL